MLDLDVVFDDDRQPGTAGKPRVSSNWDGVSPGGTLTATPAGYLAPAELPEPWREFYEERAAIREYDGNQPREHAEADAWSETLAAMRRGGEFR